MRQFRNVMRSRAVSILSGTVVAILVVPATALATGSAGPNGAYHPAATASGASEGLVILLGVLAVSAVAVLSLVILSRAGAEGKGAQRPATSIRRKPAGIAS